MSRYREALRLGPEAPYYFALHLSAAGLIDEARKMLEIGERNGTEPFVFLCMLEATRTGSPEQRLGSIDRLLALEGSNPRIDKNALEKERFELLLSLGRFSDIDGDIPNWYSTHAMTDALASSFPLLPSGYPELFTEITACRVDLYRKEYQRAWLRAETILKSGVPQAFERLILSDFGKAALYGSRDFAGDALFWDSLSGRDWLPDARYVSSFYAGRLYGQAGDSENARKRLASAMKLAATASDYDNALWYFLDLSGKESPEKLFQALTVYAGTWKNPQLFSEMLNSLIVQLVKKKDWKRILELRETLSEAATPEIKTQLDYLASRSGKLSSDAKSAALERAFESDHGSLYYRVLSAEALGIPIGSPERIVYKQNRGEAGNGAEEEARAVLHGYIAYKLGEKVYPVAAKDYPALTVALAGELGELLTAAGRPSDALRLNALALGSTKASVTDDHLRLLYPRPWLAEVSEAAARFNIPEYLLYALIRSESYFQADVVSRAGAIGLSQLMKPTAGDIARKLKMEGFDLADPGTNILFGAYYLSELITRLDGRILPSLFAYNAGITRVRQWQKTAAGLPDDLFLETLPYAETREYGRKVLASASVYGYLYYQKTTGDIVREIF